MKQIERFFHIRPRYGIGPDDVVGPDIATKGGATVRVVGHEGAKEVLVQVALCSANDAFCRATGRDVARKHVAIKANIDALPGVLSNISRMVTRNVLKLSRSQRQQHHLWNTDYSFATKYFAAKKEAVTA